MAKTRKTKDIWPLWMGIRGFRFVYRGDWNDPEVVMNAHALGDEMWALYEDRCRKNHVIPSDEGVQQFCRDEAERLREYAQDMIDSGQARRFVGSLRYSLDLFSKGAPALRAIPA